MASLNNAPFDRGYVIEKEPVGIPDGGWKDIFNSTTSPPGRRGSMMSRARSASE